MQKISLSMMSQADIPAWLVRNIPLPLLKKAVDLAEENAAQQSVQADVLESPACCASFVAYGVHHEDCRNNPARR